MGKTKLRILCRVQNCLQNGKESPTNMYTQKAKKMYEQKPKSAQ